MNLSILIPPRTSFINETLSSLAFIRLSMAFTLTFPATWFNGRNRHVTSNPNKQETPSKLYRKMVPTISSTGASASGLSAQSFPPTSGGLTDEREQVPREITDAIDVSGHEGHNLSL